MNKVKIVPSLSEDAPPDNMEAILWGQGNESCAFHTAALLDPLAWPGLQELLKEYETESLALFSGYIDREHAEIMPRCVMLTQSSPLALQLAHSLPERGALFLRWEAARKKSLADVAAWLSRAGRAWLPDGRGVWFRWYDPIIFSDFWPLAHESQRAFLMGDWIDCIWLFHPIHKQWEIFPNARDARLPERLDISAEQVERMGENSFERFIHRVVMRLHAERSCLPATVLEPYVRQSIQAAEEHGITEQDALAGIACLDARSGWRLWDDADTLALLHAPGKSDREKVQALEIRIEQHNRRETL